MIDSEGYLTEQGWQAMGFSKGSKKGRVFYSEHNEQSYTVYARHTPESLVQMLLRWSYVEGQKKGLT